MSYSEIDNNKAKRVIRIRWSNPVDRPMKYHPVKGAETRVYATAVNNQEGTKA